MEFRVPCECGKDVTVTAGQAGLTVHCECGRAVAIPSYRELRAAASLPPPRVRAGSDATGPPVVSPICPACGGTTFRRVIPYHWVAFQRDRECKDCDNIYTPPTPRWA